MKIIQAINSEPASLNNPIGYYAILFIIFGLNSLFNIIRPIYNLYTIYFEITWAEFPFLELFDILTLIFSILLVILGFSLFYYQKFTKMLLIIGGITLFLFNLLNPIHFLMLGNLFSAFIGNPPVWMQVIPGDLLIIYLCSWSILSISNVILQIFGFYTAIRICLNSKPPTRIIYYLFFYCWMLGLSGIILLFQSITSLSLTNGWTSLAFSPYILYLTTWICMILTGITGIWFLWNWGRNKDPRVFLKFGQIAIISFCIMSLSISFSDIAMKTLMSLSFNVIIALILVIFAFKLPIYFQSQKKPALEG
ncbi:MAG TPA: hypothetical protein VMV49_05960 [Candidatus Deferrimicrobium sp.]|nr:hypothetical protein [Candidatus Deferrimicrobium sp.]